MWSLSLLKRVQKVRLKTSVPKNAMIFGKSKLVVENELTKEFARTIKRRLGVTVIREDLVFYIEDDLEWDCYKIAVYWQPHTGKSFLEGLGAIAYPDHKQLPPKHRTVVGVDIRMFFLKGWDDKNFRWVYTEREDVPPKPAGVVDRFIAAEEYASRMHKSNATNFNVDDVLSDLAVSMYTAVGLPKPEPKYDPLNDTKVDPEPWWKNIKNVPIFDPPYTPLNDTKVMPTTPKPEHWHYEAAKAASKITPEFAAKFNANVKAYGASLGLLSAPVTDTAMAMKIAVSKLIDIKKDKDGKPK